MKKIIIPIILIALALVAIFTYGKCIKCKKIPFDTVLDKEYVYLNNEVKTNITLTFTKDGIFGFGGVNKYFAGYKVDDKDQIILSPIGSTMMAGSEEAMQLERQYFELLKDVNRVKVYKDKLVLMTSNDKKLKFVEIKKDINNNNNSEIIGPEIKSETIKK